MYSSVARAKLLKNGPLHFLKKKGFGLEFNQVHSLFYDLIGEENIESVGKLFFFFFFFFFFFGGGAVRWRVIFLFDLHQIDGLLLEVNISTFPTFEKMGRQNFYTL